LADANSTYHSIQAQIRQQFSRGFSGQFTYIWSKALGDGINSAIRDQTLLLDPRNRSRNKSRLSFDRTQAVNAHGTWELPFGPGKPFLAGAPAFVHRAVEGWQLSSIITFTSGGPMNLTSSVLTMGGTRITSVPDAVGSIDKSLGKIEKGKGFVQYFPGLSPASAPLPDFGSDPGNLKTVYSNRVIADSSGKALLANPAPGKVGTLGLRYL